MKPLKQPSLTEEIAKATEWVNRSALKTMKAEKMILDGRKEIVRPRNQIPPLRIYS